MSMAGRRYVERRPESMALGAFELLAQHYAVGSLDDSIGLTGGPPSCLDFASYKIVFCATIFKIGGTAGRRELRHFGRPYQS
jgi:hypothetical protein